MFRALGITLAVVALSACVAHAAYDFGSYVPQAWMDPTVAPPSRPEEWSSEVAGYYYVNNTTGTDSGRTYGTPTAPRATIPNPIPAGSRVELAGTYNVNTGGVSLIKGAGTSAAWVAGSSGPAWVVADTGTPPTITGRLGLIEGTYTYCCGIKWVGVSGANTLQISSSGATPRPADHIAVISCDIQGVTDSGAGLAFAARSDTPCADFVVWNTNIHDHGPAYDIDQDSHMISVGSYWSRIWILNNQLANSSGSGMQFGGSSPGPSQVYVRGNTVTNSRQSGIWCKYGTAILVEGNTVSDVRDRCVGADTSPSKGLGAQYLPVGVWWINNTVENCRFGIRLVSTDGGAGRVYAIGNLLYNIGETGGGSCFGGADGDTWQDAGMHLQGAAERYIWNNTIYDVAGNGLGVSGNAATASDQRNNIIVSMSDADGYFVDYVGGTARFDRNMAYTTAANAVRRGGTTTYATIAAWQSAQAVESTNNTQQDPLFVNAASANFALQDGSPAQNAGYDWRTAATAAFNSDFSTANATSMWVDRNGVAFDTTPDLGAIQYSAETPLGNGTMTATTANVGSLVITQ
jgi:hypothetical protein